MPSTPEQRRLRYQANPQKYAAQRRDYRHKHLEKEQARVRDYYWRNHAKMLERGRSESAKRYQRDPEALKAYFKKWVIENPERRKATTKLWRIKTQERRRQRQSERRLSDEKYKARVDLQTQFRQWLINANTRRRRIEECVNGTKNEYRAHFEKHFLPGWSWENYGKDWEVDHIAPRASFDLTISEERKRCFALLNLRPLTPQQNNSKQTK